MKGQYPPLPGYDFSWRSVQLEPIPGSGERITVATLVKGGDNSFIAAKLLNSAKLKALYGTDFAESISDALSHALRDAEAFYQHRPLSVDWLSPFEGFSLGSLAYSLANSFEEGLLRAAASSSSFALSELQSRVQSPSKATVSAPEMWRRSIFESIQSRCEDYAGYFNRSILVSDTGIPIVIDFLSARYAAQFEAIVEPRSIQQTLVRAQSKLWQLDRIRDAKDLFKPSTFELLIRTPSSPGGSEDASLIDEFVNELRFEASRREISIFPTTSPAEAANRLMEQAA